MRGQIADPWVAIIEAEVHLALTDGYVVALPPTPKNARNYLCKVAGCPRCATAKGLCNLHYLRAARGVSLEKPVGRGNQKTPCRICGATTRHGGWSLCQKHYKTLRRSAIKKSLVRLMGGLCDSCGEDYPHPVFDFHHQGDKNDGIGTLLESASITVIVAEARKCILMCANCHRIEHHAG